MGVDTEAFLKTKFDEFDRYLSVFITSKDKGYSPRPYMWSYSFDYFGENRHSLVYNQKVDVKEYERREFLPKEEFKKEFDKKEKLPVTDMDSRNLVADGVPDGFHGIKLGFGLSGRAQEFIQLMCYIFGGWYQPSDSSGEDYYWIEKNWYKAIQVIFEGSYGKN